jgi:salicylate 5-hydroxylase large subunit
MNIPTDDAAAGVRWHTEGFSRVPYEVYSDEALYRRELERFFYRGHWCYVGLVAEIPEPGDFKRSWVGERSVIVVRNHDGTVHVVENRCAHRGVQFCQQNFGRVRDFICPYHQWNYDLTGRLLGLPLRRGIKRGGSIQGGMPADFKLEEHGLTQLKVTVRGGVIFASFDHSVAPFEEFLGADVLGYFDRVFNGRALRVLGYSRQRIPGNWKLMQENIKDPYHPGLLHTWFVTFGLWRADQESRMVMDATGRHACMVSKRNSGGKGEVTQGVASFKDRMQLNDDRVLDVVPEDFWKGPTVVMTTVFPSVIIQQQVNSVSTRHIVPRGPGVFDFIWTHFGFDDDTPEMTRRRLRQANLFGPAGYVSADDGEVIEMAQAAMQKHAGETTVSELDGRDAHNTEHMVTETLIRGMYRYYREVMQL